MGADQDPQHQLEHDHRRRDPPRKYRDRDCRDRGAQHDQEERCCVDVDHVNEGRSYGRKRLELGVGHDQDRGTGRWIDPLGEQLP